MAKQKKKKKQKVPKPSAYASAPPASTPAILQGELEPEPNRLPYIMPPVGLLVVCAVWVVVVTGGFSLLHLKIRRQDHHLDTRLQKTVKGQVFVFATSGKGYKVLEVVNDYTAIVEGDASGEAADSDFHIGVKQRPFVEGRTKGAPTFGGNSQSEVQIQLPPSVWQDTPHALMHQPSGFPSGFTYVGLVAGLIGALAACLWGLDIVTLHNLNDKSSKWKIFIPTLLFPPAFALGMLLMNPHPLPGFLSIALAGALLLYIITHDTGRRGDPFPET